MRFLYYSSSAVIPVALIAFVPELRTRPQRFCFSLLAINEESHNELYSIEIPGIHLKKSSCILVKIHTYLTRVNPSVTYHADVLRGWRSAGG